MSDFGRGVGAILLAVIGVAIVAVVLSQRSQTVGVIGAFTQGFSQILGTAISPVSGNGSSVTNQYSQMSGAMNQMGSFL